MAPVISRKNTFGRIEGANKKNNNYEEVSFQKQPSNKLKRQPSVTRQQASVVVDKKRELKVSFKQATKKGGKSRPPSRTRKSQHQKDTLWTLFQDLKGETPSKERITKLSKKLDLSENQIYKWFWDTKKKVEEDEKREQNLLEQPLATGKSGDGQNLTPFQIKQALKINQQHAERETEFEKIANTLGIDIEAIAQNTISAPSPTHSRQIIRQEIVRQESLMSGNVNVKRIPSFGSQHFQKICDQQVREEQPKLTKRKSQGKQELGNLGKVLDDIDPSIFQAPKVIKNNPIQGTLNSSLTNLRKQASTMSLTKTRSRNENANVPPMETPRRPITRQNSLIQQSQDVNKMTPFMDNQLFIQPKTSLMLNNASDLNLNRNMSAFSDFNPVGKDSQFSMFFSQQKLAQMRGDQNQNLELNHQITNLIQDDQNGNAFRRSTTPLQYQNGMPRMGNMNFMPNTLQRQRSSEMTFK